MIYVLLTSNTHILYWSISQIKNEFKKPMICLIILQIK